MQTGDVLHNVRTKLLVWYAFVILFVQTRVLQNMSQTWVTEGDLSNVPVCGFSVAGPRPTDVRGART